MIESQLAAEDVHEYSGPIQEFERKPLSPVIKGPDGKNSSSSSPSGQRPASGSKNQAATILCLRSLESRRHSQIG
jgi:hypothetical protein